MVRRNIQVSCLLFVTLLVGVLVTAQPQAGGAEESIGVLVGQADQVVSITVAPGGPGERATVTVTGDGAVLVEDPTVVEDCDTLGFSTDDDVPSFDTDYDDLDDDDDGDVQIMPTDMDYESAEDQGTWFGVISTPNGRFGVVGSLDRSRGRDTFTYEVVNVSYENGGKGITSLSIPFGSRVGPSDSEVSTDGGRSWERLGAASEKLALGTLGGFIQLGVGSSEGVKVGGSAIFRFSLPALSPPSGEEPTTPGTDDRFAPGVFLNGAVAEAVSYTHLTLPTN